VYANIDEDIEKYVLNYFIMLPQGPSSSLSVETAREIEHTQQLPLASVGVDPQPEAAAEVEETAVVDFEKGPFFGGGRFGGAQGAEPRGDFGKAVVWARGVDETPGGLLNCGEVHTKNA
jgi:hypothetical protein